VLGSAGDRGRQFLGGCGEGRGVFAVDDEPGGGVETSEVGEIVLGQPGSGVPGKPSRVFGLALKMILFRALVLTPSSRSRGSCDR
jgi:hypothetical protein